MIASRAEVDEDGRYTGEMAFYAYGPFKARAMEELAGRLGLDLSASYAYSDSYTDLPMLESVGHPVAVNPDRVLARLARERDYEVRHFVRPVRLRDAVRDRVRETQVRPAVAVSLGAVAVTALAGALGWWLGGRRLRRHRALQQLAALPEPTLPGSGRGAPQVVRRRLAATTPAAASAARMRSFFSMGASLVGRPGGPGGGPGQVHQASTAARTPPAKPRPSRRLPPQLRRARTSRPSSRSRTVSKLQLEKVV